MSGRSSLYFLQLVTCWAGIVHDDLDKPHKWVPAEQCTFVNPPVMPYYWDESCVNGESLGCWADGVHGQCRFCGEAPYLGLHCPDDAIVPYRYTCHFDNPPVTPYYWDPDCKKGDLGCLADNKNVHCRFCGDGDYASIPCPSSSCTFDNEPITPYYWESKCTMGMLGCNADGIHVQCRFCDYQPFNPIHCPESARPAYPDGACWFPNGTPQSHKWDKSCKWGKKGCWADGVNAQCRFCGPGSGGIYNDISCDAAWILMRTVPATGEEIRGRMMAIQLCHQLLILGGAKLRESPCCTFTELASSGMGTSVSSSAFAKMQGMGNAQNQMNMGSMGMARKMGMGMAMGGVNNNVMSMNAMGKGEKGDVNAMGMKGMGKMGKMGKTGGPGQPIGQRPLMSIRGVTPAQRMQMQQAQQQERLMGQASCR
ncbi:unnamed protein product [Effrenium voratum]|nr:unnamed protein product [Effrenium voratum]